MTFGVIQGFLLELGGVVDDGREFSHCPHLTHLFYEVQIAGFTSISLVKSGPVFIWGIYKIEQPAVFTPWMFTVPAAPHFCLYWADWATDGTNDSFLYCGQSPMCGRWTRIERGWSPAEPNTQPCSPTYCGLPARQSIDVQSSIRRVKSLQSNAPKEETCDLFKDFLIIRWSIEALLKRKCKSASFYPLKLISAKKRRTSFWNAVITCVSLLLFIRCSEKHSRRECQAADSLSDAIFLCRSVSH